MAHNFSDFNIEPDFKNFAGEKLQINDILNKQIEVTDYVIEDSTTKKGTKRLKLQFKLEQKLHICFFGSIIMQGQILKVDRAKFPFITTIVSKDKHMKFT